MNTSFSAVGRDSNSFSRCAVFSLIFLILSSIITPGKSRLHPKVFIRSLIIRANCRNDDIKAVHAKKGLKTADSRRSLVFPAFSGFEFCRLNGSAFNASSAGHRSARHTA